MQSFSRSAAPPDFPTYYKIMQKSADRDAADRDAAEKVCVVLFGFLETSIRAKIARFPQEVQKKACNKFIIGVAWGIKQSLFSTFRVLETWIGARSA